MSHPTLVSLSALSCLFLGFALTEQDPDRIFGWGELAKAMYASGSVETAETNHAPAAEFYRKCVNILKQLDAKGKLNGYREYRDLYGTARQALKLSGARGE